MSPLFWVKSWLLILIGFLLFPACIFNTSSSSSNHSETLKEKVEKDNKDGLSSASLYAIDETGLPETKFIAEKNHSSISFKTMHFEVVNLIGWFEEFDIIMYSDRADFTDAVIFGRVHPNSIKMPNPKMMDSAQKIPYIDSENYTEISFKSDSFNNLSEDKFRLNGKMQLNGIQKPMIFEATFNGYAYPAEKRLAGFDVYGKFSRHDFNVASNEKLHSGKLIHGDSIELFLSLRMEKPSH